MRALPGGLVHKTSGGVIVGDDNSSIANDDNSVAFLQRAGMTDAFNDRIIQYLADCLVCSRSHLVLSDCELSVYGRKGFRAIARALRRSNGLYVLPSIFMGPKHIRIITHLDLSRNELDDGDCVLLSEVMLYQHYLLLTYNRIGAKGFLRMCKVIKVFFH